MQAEFDGHMKTYIFPTVDRVPKGRNPVSSKWCFDYKADKDGKITKFKASLVARGFTQIRDVNYTYSSSPLSFFSFYQAGSSRSKEERTPTPPL